jgi:hypothetical protein
MPKIDDDTFLELYFTKCDFYDECDKCGNPKHEQSWAQMAGDNEVDYYLCQTCALKLSKQWDKEAK